MVKAKGSCLKIFACGGAGDGESEAKDDANVTLEEGKTLSDKGRWSFRRRSTRHRVLKNSDISEPETVTVSKEILNSVTNQLGSPKYSSVVGKTVEQEQPGKNAAPPTEMTSVEVEATAEDVKVQSVESTDKLQAEDELDAAATVVQAAMRGYLARKALLKHQKVVKLQAAVRGHLVRRQAVGTLQFLLAIIRAQEEKMLKASARLEGLEVKRNHGTHDDAAARLLENGYVRKILETGPATESIYVKCKPSESDSMWVWFERWTALTSSDAGHWIQQREILETENGEVTDGEVVEDDPSPSMSKASPTLTHVDQNDNTAAELMTAFSSEVLTDVSDDSVHSLHNVEQQKIDSKTEDIAKKSQISSNDDPLEPETVDSSIFAADELEHHPDNSKDVSKLESLEMEMRKLSTRKTCNPAFAAVQLKFEELSTNSAVGNKPSGFYPHDDSKKLRETSLNSEEVSAVKTLDGLAFLETSDPRDTGISVAASECGTEISISSTLDSPRRSELEGGEIVLEIGSLRNSRYVAGGNSYSVYGETNNRPNLELPDRLDIMAPISDLKRAEESELANAQIAENLEEKLLEGTPNRTSDLQSYGTPMSEESVHTNSRGDKKEPKQKPLSGKRLLSNLSNDSVGRSNENAPKDPKNTKRQGHSAAAKSDHTDHEPRVSSSNPLPSYMQATESAKAKLNASVSPKLSPDSRESNAKKRHSLPIANANGRQESSPRMQRSTSQAQQTSKGTPNSFDRRWQI